MTIGSHCATTAATISDATAGSRTASAATATASGIAGDTTTTATAVVVAVAVVVVVLLLYSSTAIPKRATIATCMHSSACSGDIRVHTAF
eukprot:15585-Heterococcus_DN1.PRE.3